MLVGMLFPGALGAVAETEAAEAGKIEISTPEELTKIGKDAAFPMTGDYVLTNDLDMSGINFTPIGGTHGEKGAVSGNHVFSGTFDGQGHLISNLTIDVSGQVTDYAQIGLFSVVASANASDYARVSNLVFANVSLTVDMDGGFTAAGTLAGEVNGYAEIENIAVLDGNVIVNADNGSDTVGAAGVIGECRTNANMGNNYVTVKNIYNGAQILAGSSTNNNYASGIIGRVSVTPCKAITGCVNTGRTSYKGDLGTGIANFAYNVDSRCVTNSYFLFDTGRAVSSTELEESVLKSGVLPDGLSETAWYASEGSYPLPVMCKEGGASEYLGLMSVSLGFAKGENAASVTQDIELPLTAGDKTLTWTSSNPAVIEIDGAVAKVKGVMSPVTVTLTASASDGKSRRFNVTVVSNVTAAFDQGYAKPGQKLTVVISNAPEDLQCSYTWSVGGKTLTSITGDSYTPTEADKEKFIKVVVKAKNYSNAEWNVSMYMSDLPVIYIDTEDGRDVTTKEYKDSNLRLQGNDEYTKSSVLYNGAAEIKGRGNSTWDYSLSNGLKKPFKIKLDKKTDVLGMGKNKHWVLLANAIDHTNMRNQLMYEFAEDIGMACVMDSKPVILVMNGEYVGFYELCEHKRVGETRINVFDWEGLGEDIAAAIADAVGLSKGDASDLEEQMTLDFSWYDTGNVTFKGTTYKVADYYTDEIPEFTGGFALDMDFRIDDSKNISKFRTRYGYPMIFEAPEYAKTSPSMMNYVQTYLQAFEDAIHDDDYYAEYDGEEVHYSELYDIDSLLQNWYLVEYSMNWDGMKNSTLMYKDLDGKLTMGPAWDFDWCWGNINMYSMTGPSVITGWHTTEDSFCEQAYQRENWNRYLASDPYFMTLAYEKWQEIRGTVIEDMIKDGGKIDRLTEEYRIPSEANDAKWASTYNKYSGYSIAADGSKKYTQSETYADAVNSMKNYIKLRVAWMDKQFTSVDNLLASLGRYKGSGELEVAEIKDAGEGKTEITASVTNSNAKKIAFYVNGIRAGEADVKSGRAVLTVSDAMLRSGENKTNTVQIRALDASGAFLKNNSTVLTNYKNFEKTTSGVISDKMALQRAIASAKQLKEDDYTAESWAAAKIADVIAAAEAVMENADATQEEVDAAVKALADAQKLLEQNVDLLLDFTFDDAESGFKGGQAVAEPVGELREVDGRKALYLNGSEFLNVTKEDGSSLLTNVQAMTVSFDMKPTAHGATGWPYYAARSAAGQAGGNEIYTGILIQNNGTLMVERYLNGRGEGSIATAGKNDQWSHVEVQYNETETILSIDGVEIQKLPCTYSLTDIFGENSILQIGKANWGNGEYFQGYIDNYKIAVTKMAETPKTDKTALQKAIADAEKLDKDKYTADTWEAVETALADAKKVNDNEAATQKMADDAVTALENAVKALEEKPIEPDKADKSKLQEAVDHAVPDTDKEKYTEDSWAAYEKALDAAKKVLEDEKAEQEAVDEAEKALADAADALEKKPPTPPITKLPYVDVEEDAWYYDAVAYNYYAKTMTGLDPTHFGPSNTLVRGQFAAVLHKMNEMPVMEYTDLFSDVTEPDWFKDAVLWAAEKKIVTGYTGTDLFGPNDPVTRAQMATMMYRYAKEYKGYELKEDGDYSSFPDAGEVQEFAVDALKWAVAEEIITGKTIDGQLLLDPQGSANRAECATIIQRFLEKYGEEK